MDESIKMTIPQWGLAMFIGWTIVVVVLLLNAVRIRHLATGGSAKDFGTPNDESLLWRLFRAQANLVENLPLYIGVVFLLTMQDVSGAAIDRLIVVYMIFRIAHSIIHMAGLNPNLRLISLAVQLSCLSALTALAVL